MSRTHQAFRILLLTWIAFWLATDAGAQAASGWAGEWSTSWRDGEARMTLAQSGDRVTGSYQPRGGRIDAQIVGQVLRGRWIEGQVSGGIVFALAPDGQTFTGRFDSGEYWNGSRIDPARLKASGSVLASSPRETLKSLLVAANEAFYGNDVEALERVEQLLVYEGDEPLGPTRNRRRSLLWQLLDMSTLRIYEAPPRPQGDEAEFEIGPYSKRARYALKFRRQAAGSWAVLVQPEPVLKASVDRFLTDLGQATLVGLNASRRESPRSTMFNFLVGTHRWADGGKDQALATLDLSRVPADLRTIEGPLLADYLKQILDRAGYVIWQEIPDDPNLPIPYVYYEHPLGNIAIENVPGAEGKDARWLFSAETLRRAPQVFLAMQDLPKVEGLGESRPLTPLFRVREKIRDSAPALLRRVAPLELWQWLALLAAGVLTIATAWVVAYLVRLTWSRVGQWGGLHQLSPPHHFDWPVRLAVVGALFGAALAWLGVFDAGFEVGQRLLALLAVIGVTALGYRLVETAGAYFVRRAENTSRFADEIVTSLATGLAKLVIVLGGLVVAAETLELPYEGVITGLGIGGVALAFAARETVANMLGGALLMTDRPFRRGDLVETDGQMAEVQNVGLRSTRLRRLDDSILIIPNSQLSDKAIVNWGMRRRRRVDLSIRLTYGTPRDKLDTFVQRLHEVFRKQPKADAHDCYVALKDFGDSAIEIECRGFFQVRSYEQQIRARHALIGDIIDLAEQVGVHFALPTRTVHLLNEPPPEVSGAPAAEAGRPA